MRSVWVHNISQICIHSSMYIYIHTPIQTYMHTYTHTYIPTYLHTYIPAYLRTYIPAYFTYMGFRYHHAQLGEVPRVCYGALDPSFALPFQAPCRVLHLKNPAVELLCFQVSSRTTAQDPDCKEQPKGLCQCCQSPEPTKPSNPSYPCNPK